MGLLDPEEPATLERPVAMARLVWAGPLTVATSLALVHLVRPLARRIPGVRQDCVAFSPVAVTADTAVLCSVAVLIFALMSALHDESVRRFRWLAFGALLASFLPLLLNPEIGNALTAAAVASMHVAAYIPCVTLLPALSRAPSTTRIIRKPNDANA